MKIRDVEWYVLKVPMERVVYNSQGGIKEKMALLVRIATDEGLEGWGESWANFPTWISLDRLRFLEKDLKPFLVGKDLENRESLTEEMIRRYSLLGLQWGAVGLVSQMISAVDIALWDLEGKQKGKPIYQLLGGEERRDVTAYASGNDQENLEAQLQSLLAKGFRGIKIRVGFGKEKDLAAIGFARNFLGEDILLAVDVNQGWSRQEAEEMVEGLAPYGLEWIEEPLRADDIQGLRLLGQKTATKLAAGENVYGYLQFEALCDAIPIIQPDITKQGGFTGLIKLHVLAREKGCRLIPHNFGAAVGLAATIHFLAGLCGEELLELDSYPNPLMLRLAEGFPVIKEGKVQVPAAPGLGICLDRDFVRHHKIDI